MARLCTVCKHPDREMIDKELVTGSSARAAAAKHGLDGDAVLRHRKNHVGPLVAKARAARERAALRRGAQLMAEQDKQERAEIWQRGEQERAEIRQGDRLMTEMYNLLKKANAILDAQEGKPEIELKAIHQVRETVRTIAELEGRLHANPVINFVGSPQWTTLRTAIISSLDPYPEAKLAMVKCLGDDLANVTPHGRA